MSLTIHVVGRQTDWVLFEPQLHFDDDATYWYLQPFFDALREATGQYIDLYGGAWFLGDDLEQLHDCLVGIRIDAAKRGRSWEQLLGEADNADVAIVQRDDVLNLVDRFLAAVAEARQTNRGIACAGD